MWTQFWDMSTGGYRKLKWKYIYIEAPWDEVKVIFYNKLGRNPDKITCSCCGRDYSTHTGETLENVTGYHRGCAWDDENEEYLEKQWTEEETGRPYMPLDKYIKEEDVLVIRAVDILPEERVGTLPRSGWVYISE